MSAATEIRWRKTRGKKEWRSSAGYVVVETEPGMFETSNPDGDVVIFGFLLRLQQSLADELAQKAGA